MFTKRTLLAPHIERVQIAMDALPTRFISRSNQQTIRVLNALDAARDCINRAHREINKELNQ